MESPGYLESRYRSWWLFIFLVTYYIKYIEWIGKSYFKFMNKGLIAKSVGVGIAGIAAGTAAYALSNEKTRKKVGQTISKLVKEGRATLNEGREIVQQGRESALSLMAKRDGKSDKKIAKSRQK